ncbi:sulfurtransferase [Curvibacter sp. APW13]|uniref:sulfurtransferase n=1 Tax=Curvibacter sp. APW13 TaxID=3077236 RepID=UPI0028DD64CF|nr:sulfurtransferase [Curvibacter sp. APW13]MDT8989306.1 sulfurtransferase [Curvibacter sp. APW13]
MPYSTLITVEQLQALQSSGSPLVIFDCSSELANPQAGPEQFAQQHIAGARYAHLDLHLSAKGERPAVNGGRHPLPTRESFAQWIGSQGVGNSTQVVVYDRQGVHYCGRLWWMLQWLGHEAVAVLDGGLQAWVAAGGATATGEAAPATACDFALHPPRVTLVDADTVLAHLGQPDQHIIDARGAPRFRGEVEPLDPKAGHIPGALNRPFTSNFGPDGKFKPAAQLRSEFQSLLGQRDAAHVVHHCGSGVTAVPNVLAMVLAGYPTPALFAGSWSEWCAHPDRPVAQG